MAAAPGFTIATSLSGAIGGLPSPVKSGRATPTWKGPSASQLLDQIKNLEAEGNKLRADSAALFGNSSLSEMNTSNGSTGKTDVSTGKPEVSPGAKPSSLPPSLSALVDISSEQKTISDLRLQLDQQRKETERLSTHLLSDGFSTSTSSRVGTVLHIPSSPSKTGFSTLPSTELFSSRRHAGTSSAIETGPPSHMEKALKDSQEQVADLRRRLIEATELTESQKRQFRQSIEELKAKLHDTMINKDMLMELKDDDVFGLYKQKEVSTLESKIFQQDAGMKELQHKLKVQEQGLAEASRKADGYSRENFLSETTLNQVRVILVDAERRRGKAYFESDPASQQSPAMLVHTLERCIQEMNKDAEDHRTRVTELERELSELKRAQTSDQKNLSFEHHQRITQMTVEHEKQLQTANEKTSGLRKQVSALENQLSGIQSQHEQQLRMKEDTLKEMENKIKHLREELHEERENYTNKRENLEQTLSGTEKEMSKLRSERDEACRNHSAMETKVADLQLTINRLQREMQTEKENAGKFWDREGQLRSKQSELESRLEEKTREADRLEKMLATVKQECNATVSEKISLIERQERERHMDKISNLTSQLSEVSEKCNKVSLELETAKSENRDFRSQLRELSERTDTTKVQYEATTAEKKHLTDMLAAKTSDYERVSQERDYYFNMMEQKNNELSQVKLVKDRQTLQLEEREKNISILQEQMAKLQQVLQSTSQTSETLQEERDVYAQKLQETTTALEELKGIRDNMAKKMKIREKRLRELEGERQKVGEEVELRTKEMDIIQQEKETLFKELKESRYEVSNLSVLKDEIKKEYESTKYQLEKTIGKLQYRIKTLDHDLSLTQKALRKRESVDNTAVKMADKMQKEVTTKRSQIDTLQSKVKWFQDQIDTLIKEKSHLDEDKDKLKTSLNKSLVQSQHLAAELEAANKRCLELKEYSGKMESSLEKSVLRNATTQAQVEMFEQEMTRMKLTHQLEVKEAVQKAMRPEKLEPSPQYQESGRGTSVSSSETSKRRGGPEQVAKTERIKAQKSGENYKELGSELKYLLDEMRTLVEDRKESDARPTKPARPSRPVREARSRSHTVQALPLTRKPAFMHYRVNPNDISYHSDTEADERVWPNRSRTVTGTFGLYSPERDVSSRRSQRKHRRSKSAEASFSMMKDDSSMFDSDYRASGLSSRAPESDITDIASTITNPTDTADESVTFSTTPLTLEDTDFINSLSIGSPIMESTKESSSPSPEIVQLPDTQALCRRLEEKIASLTKMGGTLQKENKEMAELMKNQGKKLKKVKETEKQIRKKKR